MRTRWMRLVLAGLAVAAGAVALLWVLMGPVTEWVIGPDVRSLAPADQAVALADVRGQVLATAGFCALVVLITAGIEYHRRIRERDKVADRFHAAITLLGSDNVIVRGGGIRTLERIWQDVPGEHDRILETITGFIRRAERDRGDTSGRLDRPADDVAAAVTALRRRPARPERSPLDLTGGDLRGADLRDMDLSGAVLAGTTLSMANLTGAVLTRADLSDSNLERVVLDDADLTKASLWRANLAYADFGSARLHEANLSAARLDGADLSRAVGLTSRQIEVTKSRSSLKLPEGVEKPERRGF